jgi:hypothetical protein
MSTSELKKPRDVEQRGTWPEHGGEKGATAVYNANVDVTSIDETKLIRKIDWRLLPWLSLLYLLSLLDRTSIGNAKVRRPIPLLWVNFDVDFRQLYNMVDDLRLSDKQYLLCLTIFSFPYAFFEVRPPSHGSLTTSERVPIGPKQRLPKKAAPQSLAPLAYSIVGYYHGGSGHLSSSCALLTTFLDLSRSREKLRTASR